VLNEGQVSPPAQTERIRTLNRRVATRFEDLAGKYSNVIFVRPTDTYEFGVDDYVDFTHVNRPAAMRFTRALSTYLECRVGLASIQGRCSVRFGGGWHQAERDGSDWHRWSDNSGSLKLFTSEPADLVLETDVLSLVRPNTIDVTVDGRAVTSWSITDPAWAFQRQAPLSFRSKGGQTTIGFIGHQSPMTQPNDPRLLAFALRNLRIRTSDGKTLCELNMAGCRSEERRADER
jgi:hypothetical protein